MRLYLIAGCCSASLAAQQVVRTAHPQESLQNLNANLAPLGVLATGQAAEARAQILLRPLELPGPGAVLVGIEVHSQTAGTLVYSSLNIRAAATSAATLSTSFDANLANPVTVLAATNLSVAYSATAWTTLPVTGGYVHDGQSALILDFRKVVSPTRLIQIAMDSPSPPVRTDRPQMLHATGGIGSGAAQATIATTAADPLCLRLLWTGVPAMRHRSDPGPSGNHYALGTVVTYTVEGQPGSFYISGLATSALAAPVTVPGVQGLLYVFAPYDQVAFLDANGIAVHTVTIPPAAVFVGLHVTYQAGVLDALTGNGQFTNAHDHYVNP